MRNILDLIIPFRCLNCARIIPKDQHLCIPCLHKLPYTHWKFDSENLVSKNFYNFSNFLGANALLFYKNGNITFDLLHANKYYNQPKVGELLAKLSFDTLNSIHFDSVIPIPSHKKTVKYRGYTQTHVLAKNIAKYFNVPIYTDCVERTKRNSSQTNKNRKQRLALSDKDFICNYKIENKTTLFVDDVITTGGTLKACINSFCKKNDASFYIFCVAKAN